jgi:hypothetical protein
VLPAAVPIALHQPGGGVKGGYPYLGIGAALKWLSAYGMTDKATSQNLKWQRNVNGDPNKAAAWTAEATSLSSLQFFVLMQPDQAHIMVGHSMSTIYSTTTNVESLHGKIILFTGNRRGSRECIPIVLPKISAFQWKKCKVINDKEKLCAWDSDNPGEHGKLWDPNVGAGTKNELFVPRMIALPLRAVSIYQGLKGGVMPHELLDAIENHLASPDIELNNGDEWGLIQKWLLIASQKDRGGRRPHQKQIVHCSHN